MALAWDAANAALGSFVSTLTFSHTCTGTDRFIAVEGRTSGTTAISSATYAGTAMTAHTQGASDSGGNYRLFYLANPASGANDVVITFGDANNFVRGLSTSYTGAHQTTPVANLTNATGNSTTMTWTVASATDNLVVALFFNNTVNFHNPAPQGTTVERWDQQSSASVSGDEAGAASVTIEWTTTTVDPWEGTAFDLSVAAGATAVTRFYTYVTRATRR